MLRHNLLGRSLIPLKHWRDAPLTFIYGWSPIGTARRVHSQVKWLSSPSWNLLPSFTIGSDWNKIPGRKRSLVPLKAGGCWSSRCWCINAFPSVHISNSTQTAVGCRWVKRQSQTRDIKGEISATASQVESSQGWFAAQLQMSSPGIISTGAWQILLAA